MSEHQQTVRNAVAAALGSEDDAARAAYTTLAGGTYNTVVRVDLPDGRSLVVKIPPAPGTPGLGYEQGLLRNEAVYYRAAAALEGVPVPEVVATDTTGPRPYLVMSARPGVPWTEAAPLKVRRERPALRRELGRIVARLHGVTGPGFGYPGEPFGPLETGWRRAFTAMLDGVLGDAERYRAELPVPVRRVRELLASVEDVLDDVTRPALVHFDLWEGNILLAAEGGAHGVSGIIDGERMFWGDPLADFVSLALLAGIEDDPHFLAGYAQEGGAVSFDGSQRLRLAMYRSYLYLIMLVEAEPRQHDADQRDWARKTVAPELAAALREIETGAKERA
ncbi:phosphotransferase [Streptomyces sulfonofaciens]|uniref:Phosphotransferase n=1 Tax=Streptomyces sulfonofaciens TaxID=68272 RepID=A0A919KZ07_9ACTN|nr:aminoglycoside phosphotransferase family protein [Streptomyces sulfonofaciens]GHH76886.1 phosphotransferase [Streptomyces sulfonofaciens]